MARSAAEKKRRHDKFLKDQAKKVRKASVVSQVAHLSPIEHTSGSATGQEELSSSEDLQEDKDMASFKHGMRGEVGVQSDKGAGTSDLSLDDDTAPTGPTLDHKNLYDVARRYKVEGNLARTVELARTLLQDPELSQYRRAVVNFLMIGTIPPNEIISFDEQLSYIAECHDAMMLWLDSGVTSSVETTAIYMISQLKMRVSQAIREIIRIEVVNGSRVPFEEKQLSGEGCFSDLDYAPPEWEWVALTLNSNTTEPINLWDQYVSRLLELDRNLTKLSNLVVESRKERHGDEEK